jgi:hypothetical protein
MSATERHPPSTPDIPTGAIDWLNCTQIFNNLGFGTSFTGWNLLAKHWPVLPSTLLSTAITLVSRHQEHSVQGQFPFETSQHGTETQSKAIF